MATRTKTVETSLEIGGDARIEDDLRKKRVLLQRPFRQQHSDGTPLLTLA